MNKLFSLSLAFFVFALPLFFLPINSSAAETDKNAFLVFVAVYFLILTLLKILREKRLKIVSTPFDKFLVLLALLSLSSTFLFAPNKIESLTVPLSTGTVAAAVVLYFVITQNFSRFAYFPHFLLPLSLSAAFVSLFVVVSQFYPSLSLAPLGNLFPTGLFLGLAAFLLASHLILTHFGKKPPSKANHLYPLLLFIITLGATVSLTRLATDSRPLILPFPIGWSIFLESYKNLKNFFLGVGPANFPWAFTSLRPILTNATPFWNLTANTSTSYLLTLATETGIWAALIFGYLGFTTFRLFQNLKSGENLKPYYLTLLLALTVQLVLPSNVTLFTLTFILLALLSPKREKEYKIPPKLNQQAAVFLGGLILVLGFLGFFTGKIYLADIFFRQSVNLANSGRIAESLVFAQKSIGLNPASSNAYSLSSELSFLAAKNIAANTKPDEATESAKQANFFLNNSINLAKKAIELNPFSSQYWTRLASIYQSLTGMEGAGQLALDTLSQQMRLDPVSPLPKVEAAGILLSAGQIDLAQSLLVQAISLKPDWNKPHYNLAVLFVRTQRYKEAASELERVLSLTSPQAPDYKAVQKDLEQVKSLIPPESTPSATPAKPTQQSKPPKPTTPAK